MNRERSALLAKFALILLTLALVGIAVGCGYTPPVPPVGGWQRTGEYSAADRDLTLVVMAFSLLGEGEQWNGTLFYAVLAPQELSGWQVSPGPFAVSDDRGPLGTGRGVPIETAGGVTLGAMVLSPFGYNADALKIAITTMEARNLTTGEVQEFQGDWRLVPLRNTNPLGRVTTSGPLTPVKGAGPHELTHQGTTLKYWGISPLSPFELDGVYRGPPPQPGPWWVLGKHFWLSEPEPHDIFVLVTSEGEVSRVSADEYRQRGFTIFPLDIAPLVTPDANSE